MSTATKEDRVARRRGEILEAARDIFAEKGYHSAGISDIAEKLKIGHGTFYRYFKNKLDIFNAVIDQVVTDISDVVVLEDPTLTNSLAEYHEQMIRIGEGLFFRVFLRDRRLGRILFYEAMGIDREVSGKILLAMELFSRFTERYLINGKEKGFLRDDLDTEVTARLMNAMIFEGAKHIVLSDDPEVMGRRWIESFVDLFINGAGPGAEKGETVHVISNVTPKVAPKVTPKVTPHGS